MGYVRSVGLVPPDSNLTIEAKLKQLGIYDSHFGTFQSSIASTVEDTIQGLSLPTQVDKDRLIEYSVKAATAYLKQRPKIAKSLRPTSFSEASGQSLRNLKILFDDYAEILSLMERRDIDLLIRSDMPATYFNDSIFAYRTISLFLKLEYQHISDAVNHKLVLYRSNEPKLSRAVDNLKRSVELEIAPYSQLILQLGRLRLYVNAWNSSDLDTLYSPKALSFEKLDKDSYSELNRLFKVNLTLFASRIERPVKSINAMTETMWRGLIEPLPVQ
jgi:hypothetical protein